MDSTKKNCILASDDKKGSMTSVTSSIKECTHRRFDEVMYMAVLEKLVGRCPMDSRSRKKIIMIHSRDTEPFLNCLDAKSMLEYQVKYLKKFPPGYLKTQPEITASEFMSIYESDKESEFQMDMATYQEAFPMFQRVKGAQPAALTVAGFLQAVKHFDDMQKHFSDWAPDLILGGRFVPLDSPYKLQSAMKNMRRVNPQ